MKQSIITAFLGRTQDRFSEYQEPTSLEERLDLVVKIPGVDGVEIVYPYETEEAGVTKKMFNDRGLNFAAINANIKKETQWVPGALSRSNPDIRQGAIEIIKKAKDYAKAVGAPLVTCCPLSDGYDNLFQVDYPKAWRNMVEAVAEAADYLPEVPLFIEYKINETRVHEKDWRLGDPTWQNDKGKGMIGALNYLAEREMNAFSFITMNVNGDDKNVFPYLKYNGNPSPQEDRMRFDCSKLAQWEIVFEHA